MCHPGRHTNAPIAEGVHKSEARQPPESYIDGAAAVIAAGAAAGAERIQVGSGEMCAKVPSSRGLLLPYEGEREREREREGHEVKYYTKGWRSLECLFTS